MDRHQPPDKGATDTPPARLPRVDLDTIVDRRGWLVAVTSRLCLDQLRSARSRREAYVGSWLLRFLKAGQVTLVTMPVNGQPGAIALRDGRVAAVFALTVHNGLIQHVHAIANPYKLAYVTRMLQPNP
jgi:hypothetical protein